jgi:hypothetical protein
MSGSPPPIAKDKRAIMRKVALTYRREWQAEAANIMLSL